MTRKKFVLFGAMSAAVGGALYSALAGFSYVCHQGVAFTLWHPGFLAFVGSAWVAVNAGLALDCADDKCADCMLTASKTLKLEADLADTRQALATWKGDH